MEHWTEQIEHEKLSDPATKEAFTKAYSKYDTQEDGLLGGLEAIKATGVNYKLPKSIESLPDDKMRAEFTGGVHRLLGAVDKIEDLKDLDMTLNLAEGLAADEALSEQFKKFAVENHIPKSVSQRLVGFHNAMIAEAKNKIDNAFKEKCDTVNKELLSVYGEEGVKTRTEKVRRMFQNSLGLTAEEYEQSAKGLVDGGMTQSSILCKALFNAADKLVTEGSTEVSGGGVGEKKETNYERNKKMWPNRPELWGNPNE